MGLFSRRGRRGLPPAVTSVLPPGPAGRVLAWGSDPTTGATVVATAARVIVVAADGTKHLDRPWLDVSAGSWEPMTRTISVTWVDRSRAAQWTFAEGGQRFSEVFHERVRTSVVLDAPVVLDRVSVGRAAIRRDLATGDLVRQVAWSTRATRDEAAHAQAQRVVAFLAEQVGLD